MVLHVTVLLAIHFSASLETSRPAVLPLCTCSLCQLKVNPHLFQYDFFFFFASGSWHNTLLVLSYASFGLGRSFFRCLGLSTKVSKTFLCTAMAPAPVPLRQCWTCQVIAALGSFSCLWTRYSNKAHGIGLINWTVLDKWEWCYRPSQRGERK